MKKPASKTRGKMRLHKDGTLTLPKNILPCIRCEICDKYSMPTRLEEHIDSRTNLRAYFRRLAELWLTIDNKHISVDELQQLCTGEAIKVHDVAAIKDMSNIDTSLRKSVKKDRAGCS